MGLMLVKEALKHVLSTTVVVKYSILGILINVIHVQKGFHHQANLETLGLRKRFLDCMAP